VLEIESSVIQQSSKIEIQFFKKKFLIEISKDFKLGQEAV
jgi:hypothetical protein